MSFYATSPTVRPRDFIEELWVGDVVYLTWELIRLRRAKNTLVNARMQDGLEAVLISIKDPDSAQLARLWRARDRRGTVEKALKDAGLSMDAAVAETFAMNLDEMERFDRMIMSAEARRDAILREITRHREALGAQLRNKTTEIRDAEFVEASGQPASEAEPSPADHGLPGLALPPTTRDGLAEMHWTTNARRQVAIKEERSQAQTFLPVWT
jgi:hypothetical protein